MGCNLNFALSNQATRFCLSHQAVTAGGREGQCSRMQQTRFHSVTATSLASSLKPGKVLWSPSCSSAASGHCSRWLFPLCSGCPGHARHTPASQSSLSALSGQAPWPHPLADTHPCLQHMQSGFTQLVSVIYALNSCDPFHVVSVTHSLIPATYSTTCISFSMFQSPPKWYMRFSASNPYIHFTSCGAQSLMTYMTTLSSSTFKMNKRRQYCGIWGQSWDC